MAHMSFPNVDDWRLHTGQTPDNYDRHFWDAANELPKKTYLTYPYTVKREDTATREARP